MTAWVSNMNKLVRANRIVGVGVLGRLGIDVAAAGVVTGAARPCLATVTPSIIYLPSRPDCSTRP